MSAVPSAAWAMPGKSLNVAMSTIARPVVQIKVKNVYGALQAYPANESAELLALIAGTKTLKPETLAYAERLGFAIEQVQQDLFFKVKS